MTVSLVAQHGAEPGRRKISSPELVGRARELELLVSALGAPPAVVVVEGEAGVGKTRLVTEVRARSEMAGYRVLIGGCRRIREPFPLGGPPWSPARTPLVLDQERYIVSPSALVLWALGT